MAILTQMTLLTTMEILTRTALQITMAILIQMTLQTTMAILTQMTLLTTMEILTRMTLLATMTILIKTTIQTTMAASTRIVNPNRTRIPSRTTARTLTKISQPIRKQSLLSVQAKLYVAAPLLQTLMTARASSQRVSVRTQMITLAATGRTLP